MHWHGLWCAVMREELASCPVSTRTVFVRILQAKEPDHSFFLSFFLFFVPAGWKSTTDDRQAACLVSTPHLDNRSVTGVYREKDEAEEEKQPVHQGWGSGTTVCVCVCV